jgi:phosphoribosylaminoimidazolecarboxamide formyltransferase/IMP cyclohydrolase
MKEDLPIRRALISVSDKTGLIDFATFLTERGVEILSTGGSAKAIADAGIKVREVADYTGFPEMMDGRVKTLHPKIHGGLLALRYVETHTSAMKTHGIEPIDLLVVNLYPFEATVAKGADTETCIENIDIGGPAMIRSAAKNHHAVTVVVDPADYAMVMESMAANGGATTHELRRTLALRAFGRTSTYDAAIAGWFVDELGEAFPPRIAFGGTLRQILRYGENPHQQAAFYSGGHPRVGVGNARQLQGKELSYNNLNDTDAAYELVAEFDRTMPAVAIIKHANPCGVAVGKSLREAYLAALTCDPVSAFGGVIALNRKLDVATAEEIAKIFTEVIVAPEADEDAAKLIAAKKNLRLLLVGGLPDAGEDALIVKSVAGGYLVQTRDWGRVGKDDLKVVTKRAPSPREIDDMLFAFRVAKHVKSNTIVYAKNGATVGIGAGQMSRVDSARIAAIKAKDAAAARGEATPATVGSVAASDAFFPFPDGLLTVAEAGATAVIQPGGSMRDAEVIAAADAKGLAMVFTGTRHFRH